MRFSPSFRLGCIVSLSALLAGCASDVGSSPDTPSASRVSLPAALGARWTPPAFATRPVEGDRAAVLDACGETARSLRYTINRRDNATGKISAARRQSSGFDGARQDTLEITVTTLAPGTAQVALVLRETVEPSAADAERSGAIATSALVRDRAPYDAFFTRLTDALRPADAGAASVSTTAP